MRRFLLISLVPLVVACSGPATTPAAPAVGGPASAVTAPKPDTQPAAAKPAAQSTSQPAAKTESKPASDAKPQAAAKPAAEPASTMPKATIAPPSENHGIALGQPLKIGPNSTVVLVTNTTDQVMSFTVKTEYRRGAATTTFTSTVADLLPKQSRPAMAGGGQLIPSDPESVSVAVDSVKSTAPTTPKADAAKKVQVSEPKKVEGSSNVTVDITNGDAASHLISVKSAYMKGDEMVAYGEGQAATMKAGESRTVTVRPVTPVKEYDRVEVSISLVN
jgi:hypothetical protein